MDALEGEMIDIGIWKYTKIGIAVIQLFGLVADDKGNGKSSDKVKPKPKTVMTTDLVAKIHDMAGRGLTSRQISSEIGIARSAVQRALIGGSKVSREFLASKAVMQSPIRFRDTEKYDSIIFQSGSKCAAYERLILAVSKRGGRSLVASSMGGAPVDTVRSRMSAMLNIAAKAMDVKVSLKVHDAKTKIFIVTVE